MWFDVESVGMEFTESSPFHFENEATVRGTPERVFDMVSLGEGQDAWFQDFRACRWTSAEPRGVGATREIELQMLTVKERFLTWDRGKRLTFAIYAITLPLVKTMVEDMQFEPVGEGQTRFTWRVHYRPSAIFRLVHPIARGVFGGMFAASTKGLVRYAESHG